MITYNVKDAVYLSTDLCMALSPIKQCKRPSQYFLHMQGEEKLPEKVCEHHMKEIFKHGYKPL